METPNRSPKSPRCARRARVEFPKRKEKKITNTCAFVIFKYIISNKFCFVKFIFCRYAGGAAGFISRHAGGAAGFVKFFHLAPQIQPREPLTQGGRRFRPSATPKAGPAVFAHISPQKARVFPREKTVIHPDKRPHQRFFLRREQPPAVRPNRAVQQGRVGKN